MAVKKTAPRQQVARAAQVSAAKQKQARTPRTPTRVTAQRTAMTTARRRQTGR